MIQNTRCSYSLGLAMSQVPPVRRSTQCHRWKQLIIARSFEMWPFEEWVGNVTQDTKVSNR